MNKVLPEEAGEGRKARQFSMRFGLLAMILSGTVLVVGLGVVGGSIWVSEAFKKSSADSTTLMSALRNQMTADMYHDSMRGVVYREMFAALYNDAELLQTAQVE